MSPVILEPIGPSPVGAMSVSEIIAKVKELSKHPEFSSAQALYFINQAQKELDKELSVRQGDSRYSCSVPIGGHLVNIPSCRVVKSVYSVDSASVSAPLEKKEIDWIREEYGLVPAEVESGRPVYYSPFTMRDVVNPSVSDERYGFRSILVFPPADAIYTLYVYGDFVSINLSVGGAEVSYWTAMEVNLLIDYAVMLIDINYGDQQAAESIRWKVAGALTRLDFDQVERDMAENPVVEIV